MSNHVFKRVDWFGDQPQPSDDDDEHGMPIQPPRGPGLREVDLELLTLAARALGAERVELVDGEQWVNLHFPDGSTAWNWNPLRHGDDTFNLAADLNIDVFQSAVNRETQAVAPMQRVINVPWGDDKRAATRLAVTRAAAEIAVAQGKKQA
jgi:hypothetical protein